MRFWLGAAPILFSYALLLLNARARGLSADDRAARLYAHHEACAPRALRLMQKLAGGYIKMGQVLSNRADLLPMPYVLAFGALQDQVPPRPWPHMERQLRRDAPALCRELRSVNLFDTRVGDYALVAFAGLKQLEQLYLWKTEVTAKAVVRLREQNKDLRVVFAPDLPDAMAEEPARRRRRR